MIFTKTLKSELRNQARSKAKLDKKINILIEASIDEYRDWAASQFAEGKKPITILAEGDSWFNYSLAGKDVIDKLEKLMKIKINYLASPGDEAKEMLTGEQKEKLERELKRGPISNKRAKYDILLFSGGGNDLVGKKHFIYGFMITKKGWS